MASYGEININGDDVFEALTQPESIYTSDRELNKHGRKLADLIAERVIENLATRMGLKNVQTDY